MKNTTLGALCTGAAIVLNTLFINRLFDRIDTLETNQARLEERYTAFTNEYVQAHSQTNLPPQTPEAPTNYIPQRIPRTINAFNHAEESNPRRGMP